MNQPEDPQISPESTPHVTATATSLCCDPTAKSRTPQLEAYEQGVCLDQPLEPLKRARRNAQLAFELAYIAALLPRANGSITRAAALSNVSRQMVQKLLRKHGITMPR
jgi:DNA-binding NtrC family response regulator